MLSSEEREIPIIITGIDRYSCHVIQEKTLNGSVNVCIANWIRKPLISQSTYDRLWSNGNENAVSEAEYLDNEKVFETPMGDFRGRKTTKLTLYRGTLTTPPYLRLTRQVTFVCVIVTGIREEIDTILPRRCYNNMSLRFMRRVVGGGWRTLWGQLYIGKRNQESFHVYHTEEYDPYDRDLSDVWKYTRQHRSFNVFTILKDNSCVNYPLGFIHPPEDYEWFTTQLKSAVRGSLYRDLRQLMKADPYWYEDPPAVHKRVAAPIKYNFNEWALHGFILSHVDGAVFLQNLGTRDDNNGEISNTVSDQASVNDNVEAMNRPSDYNSPIDRDSSGSLRNNVSYQASVDDNGETMQRFSDDIPSSYEVPDLYTESVLDILENHLIENPTVRRSELRRQLREVARQHRSL